jgi:hypothetical protein
MQADEQSPANCTDREDLVPVERWARLIVPDFVSSWSVSSPTARVVLPPQEVNDVSDDELDNDGPANDGDLLEDYPDDTEVRTYRGNSLFTHRGMHD